MAVDADGDIHILIESAAHMGLTIAGLTQVTLTKPAGTLRSYLMVRWLSDSDRAGYYEYSSDLVPFHGSKETHDVFEFWFTNPNTAMEFKLAFG
jgi:hypothetical protein